MTRAFELRRRYMFLSSRSRIGKHRAGLAGEQRVTASEITPWCVARDGFERVCDVTYCIISVNRQTCTQYTGLGRIDYRLLLATSPCFFPPHTQTHTLSLARALARFVCFFLCFLVFSTAPVSVCGSKIYASTSKSSSPGPTQGSAAEDDPAGIGASHLFLRCYCV